MCSVDKSCLTLCNPINCSTLGFPVLHYLLEFAQAPVHWVDDAIQLSHPLLSPSAALSLSQHQGLFQWVISSHQVAKAKYVSLKDNTFYLKVVFKKIFIVSDCTGSSLLCAQAFSCGSGQATLVAVCELLIVVASLHRAQALGQVDFISCSTQAQ